MVTWSNILAELNEDFMLLIVAWEHPIILIAFKLEHCLNMSVLSVTLLKSQPLKFNDVRLRQPSNIYFILVTLLVLKLLKSNNVRL